MSEYEHEAGPKPWISGGIHSFNLPELPRRETSVGSPSARPAYITVLQTYSTCRKW